MRTCMFSTPYSLLAIYQVLFRWPSALTSALEIKRAIHLCPMTVHVTSVPALTLLIVIACGHEGSAVFQQNSC